MFSIAIAVVALASPVATLAAGLRGTELTGASGPAFDFVGAQHWNESGWYADGGFKKHYDGYFCLCECHDSLEGVFCSGAGVHPDGVTKVADFLGVFNEQPGQPRWEGDLVAYNTTTPFSDHFTMNEAGGRANYTGVSQALGGQSFVWRGYMSGVDCAFKSKCESVCGTNDQYKAWASACR